MKIEQHELRWLALEATKAYNEYKTACLIKGISPKDVNVYIREFTDEYIVATMEVPGFVKEYMDDWDDKKIKL